MKKLLLVLLGIAALLLPAAAEPIRSGTSPSTATAASSCRASSVYVHYVLDLAEIPTVQEGDAVRAPGFAERVGERLVLEVDGQRVPLVPVEHKVDSGTPGPAGSRRCASRRSTRPTRPPEGSKLVFHDTNFRSSARLEGGRRPRLGGRPHRVLHRAGDERRATRSAPIPRICSRRRST